MFPSRGLNDKARNKQQNHVKTPLLRSQMSGGESGVRSRALGRDSGTVDRCSADGRPGDRARVQGITQREISAVRTGVWATHNAACLHCRHCSDDSMET